MDECRIYLSYAGNEEIPPTFNDCIEQSSNY